MVQLSPFQILNAFEGVRQRLITGIESLLLRDLRSNGVLHTPPSKSSVRLMRLVVDRAIAPILCWTEEANERGNFTSARLCQLRSDVRVHS